jgi:hypothetical protein
MVLGSLAVVLFSAGGLLADEVKGKVKSVDTDKNTVTLTIEKELALSLSKDVKVVQLVGKKAKKARTEDLPGGLAAVPPGSEVTFTIDKIDGKEVITQVKVAGLTQKKKKNK